MSGGMTPDEWRAHVDESLRRGSERFDDIEGRTSKLEAAVAVNTGLTQRAVDVSERTDRKVDTLRAEVQPVTDAIKTMEAGIRTIGRVGDAGTKLAKAAIVLGLLGGVLKLAFSGASWSEIYAAFWRALGK